MGGMFSVTKSTTLLIWNGIVAMAYNVEALVKAGNSSNTVQILTNAQ
jgi:hypothetical protein